MTSVQVSPVVDVLASEGNQVLVDLSATDNLTGLRSIYLQFTGPEGPDGYTAIAFASRSLSAPVASWQGRVVWTPNTDTVPGAWRLTEVQLTDLNGNTARYDETALAGLGSSTLTVRNAAKDAAAPKLVSGLLLNETLSQTATLPGGYSWLPVYIQADLVVRDRVQRGYIASGVNSAELTFCEQTALPSGCNWYNQFTLEGSVGWRRTGQYTLNTSGAPFHDNAYLTLGRYELVKVMLVDRAGNQILLTGTSMGGETDFSTMFPSTTITLTP
ncbi:MAG: hypothetical protein LCH73_01390 [Proteobacteria bacterium]|nr:hypothetical protein [Pseudomonadota bacterium]